MWPKIQKKARKTLYCILLRNDPQQLGVPTWHLKAVFGLLARPIVSYAFLKMEKEGCAENHIYCTVVTLRQFGEKLYDRIYFLTVQMLMGGGRRGEAVREPSPLILGKFNSGSLVLGGSLPWGHRETRRGGEGKEDIVGVCRPPPPPPKKTGIPHTPPRTKQNGHYSTLSLNLSTLCIGEIGLPTPAQCHVWASYNIFPLLFALHYLWRS
jgi:hypothetical protein